jgi:lipid A 3-O-deacylase
MFKKSVRGLLGLSVCAVVVLAAVPAANAMEFRAGGYAHGLKVFAPHAREPHGLDYNAEVLFDSPSWLSWLGNVRPMIGGTLAKHGTSLVYAGGDWTIDLTDAIFFDFSLGFAAHDGRLDGYESSENRYGCRVNFHESINLGYRLTDSLSIMASMEHMSNLSLCDYNEGLTNAGVRFGYSF